MKIQLKDIIIIVLILSLGFVIWEYNKLQSRYDNCHIQAVIMAEQLANE